MIVVIQLVIFPIVLFFAADNLLDGARTGTIIFRGTRVRKLESPWLFWFVTILSIVLFVVFSAIFLRLVVRTASNLFG